MVMKLRVRRSNVYIGNNIMPQATKIWALSPTGHPRYICVIFSLSICFNPPVLVSFWKTLSSYSLSFIRSVAVNDSTMSRCVLAEPLYNANKFVPPMHTLQTKNRNGNRGTLQIDWVNIPIFTLEMTIRQKFLWRSQRLVRDAYQP